MKKSVLLLTAGFVLAGFLPLDSTVSSTAAGGKSAKSQSFTVPPGNQTLMFNAGVPAPLSGLQFEMGGSPQIKILGISEDVPPPPPAPAPRGTRGAPPPPPPAPTGLNIVFPPDTTASDVTKYFKSNPGSVNTSSNFKINVNNTADREHHLQVIGNWDK